MYTSRDVARVAQVSQSTVSYVMSGKRPISSATRQRVEEAIAQLTYQPNAGARALASQRTQVIGLVVPFGPAADTGGLLPFIETIASCAREEDHDVLLVTADEGASVLTRLGGRSLCDAIVLMDIESRDERIPVAASLRVPVILIGVPEDTAGLPCVDLDYDLAARLAVGELADTGHDRLVVIGHGAETIARDLNYVRRFAEGVRAAAGERGLPVTWVEPVGGDRESIRWAIGQAVAAPGARRGLLVPNSSAVPLLIQELGAAGLVAGRDLSVVAVVTDSVATSTLPAVTNVSLEPRDVSRRAMQILFQHLDPLRDLRDEGVGSGIELVRPRLTRRGTTSTGP